ncbi:RHS repeat-associated core domain-containing protein [Pseudomonas sp. CA3A]|uniref:RHS repeat-associated core domain-containing protein n=2 Tax=Pseudomonas typographi TaxID=2715964 RepID=A0ABR7YXQ6_9PSED|nr:RHS repeat-associated core domain-containing protein [Pseudomonas typographi]
MTMRDGAYKKGGGANPGRARLLATDQADSVVVHGGSGRQAYLPFGYSPLAVRRSAFTGVYLETSPGAYLLGNGYRAYLATLMRFIAPDSWSPFGGGGMNAYAYCIAEPVNQVDRNGHSFMGFFSQVMGSTRSALIPGKVAGELAAEVPNRLLLSKAVKQIEDPQEFVRAVAMVNTNLISNSNSKHVADISSYKATHYTQLTAQVAQGEISNTTAFFQSAMGWAGDKTTAAPDRAVGTVFNIAGAFVSGGIEATKLRTGKVLHSPLPSPGTRP